MNPVGFVFGVHLHQPVGNFDHVFADHLRDVYRPLVERLAERRFFPFTLHISGPLLEWLEAHDPAYLDLIGRLVADGHVELLLAGFYEPVLASLLPTDRVEQVAWMGEAIRRRFGVTATGLWLTERVWEPDLAAHLADAGVRYVVLDDRHFLVTGVERERLHAPFWTESGGKRVALFPIDERLRYLIPFRPPAEIGDYLRDLRAAGRPLAVFVDDGEKFGGWPGTKDWVYTRGWLAQFLDAVEGLVGAGDVRLTTPGAALDTVRSGGLAYLPTASYREMEAWALPPAAARRLAVLEQELGEARMAGPEGALVRGAHWRNFLVKYAEANRMHKKMLALSGLCRERGGVIEEYTVFEHGINYADVLTRRREVYHEPPPASGHAGGEASPPPADGTPSIHELEQMARLQQLPPIDHVDRALLVDRVLAPDVTLDAYTGGAFASIVCWSRHTFEASLEHSADAVEVVLRPGAAPSGGGGLLEKRIRLHKGGELSVRYRWDPAAFPLDAFFCPEMSLAREVDLQLAPAGEVWTFPIATVSRSERGFEETVQGYSYTPRWPIRAGEGQLTLAVRRST